jgi:hypothetical protein
MVLLILIALGQLVVSLLILSLLIQLVEGRAVEQQLAERTIRGLQRQTIEALFAAEAAARGAGGSSRHADQP